MKRSVNGEFKVAEDVPMQHQMTRAVIGMLCELGYSYNATFDDFRVGTSPAGGYFYMVTCNEDGTFLLEHLLRHPNPDMFSLGRMEIGEPFVWETVKGETLQTLDDLRFHFVVQKRMDSNIPHESMN